MSEIDVLVIILICIQNYTCINYTVFFRLLSSELTYDNYCTCHSLINRIYQDILLLSIFFSETSRATYSHILFQIQEFQQLLLLLPM